MKSIFEERNYSFLVFLDAENRVRQIKLVLYIFTAILTLLVINNSFYSEHFLFPELTFILVVNSIFYFLITYDTTNVVAGMLLWTETILASYIAWQSDGLYDTAMLAFPCVLLFASMFGGKVLLIPLVLYMLSVFYFFAYAGSSGFMEFQLISNTSLWQKANNLSIILIVYGAGIVLVTTYIRKLIARLIKKEKMSQSIQQEADKLTLYDQLTELPNELLCKKKLSAYINDSKMHDEIVGFITLELCGFKWIHSSLGHSTADKILCYLSGRLQKLANEKNHLFKGAGYEFIFITQSGDYEEISNFAHQIIQAIYRPFPVESYDIEMSSSAGVSIAPFDGEAYEALRQKSHAALTHSRESGENLFKYYEVEMEEAIKKRVKMVQELKRAIMLGEFELYYQPKIDLSDESIAGVEALLRWNKNKSQIISPLDFIPVAEDSGLISEIGQWALEKACEDCKEWHNLGLSNISVAVNLSPVQFRHGNLPSIVFRALKKSELDACFLELEITESIFIEDESHIKDQIQQLSSQGISIAIDDFGTGYSNLNYLTKFNASTLKIDMSFVRDMMSSKQQEHIVMAIIKMSDVMELENVAEGVEDINTFKKLREAGCQYGQGYYWSKPLPNKEFVKKYCQSGD